MHGDVGDHAAARRRVVDAASPAGMAAGGRHERRARDSTRPMRPAAIRPRGSPDGCPSMRRWWLVAKTTPAPSAARTISTASASAHRQRLFAQHMLARRDGRHGLRRSAFRWWWRCRPRRSPGRQEGRPGPMSPSRCPGPRQRRRRDRPSRSSPQRSLDGHGASLGSCGSRLWRWRRSIPTASRVTRFGTIQETIWNVLNGVNLVH